MGERHGVDHTTLCKAHPPAPQYVLDCDDVTAFVGEVVELWTVLESWPTGGSILSRMS